ncbi:MAG TPA: 5'-nucleotidase C-terminal domain-containing protein [Gemmatimonadaceae bacterium]|jgi:2',3'-cyclic-nucleotide 2'-phosphodiesterase/3'-nucleotidase|nr:5'-nucleotidase C-terminal domain-containing protein [Gemmatimonadaceae bacterium]
MDLVVAATTDVHGRARGWDYYTDAPDTLRGLSRVATIVDSLRRVSSVDPLVVDAGDIIQGNPLAYVAARVDSSMKNPVIAAMNAIGYNAAAIGNHEFNYGVPYLDRVVGEAHFPLLATNAYTPDGARRFRGWALATRRGLRIAIIGATTPGSMVWDRDNLAGRVVIRDIVPEVRDAVRDARGAACDVVIVLLHSGLDEPSSYDTVSTNVGSENVAARVAREVRGIDLIVYGHSHKEMRDTVIGGTLLMQPKNWAQTVGVAHLGVERRNGRWLVVSKRSTAVPVVHHQEDKQVLAVTQEGHRAALRYATTAIGSTPVTWRADSARVVDTPIIDFILEVERKASGAQLASTAVFETGASIPAGPITVARLAALYPYDNTLRAVKLSGAQLRGYLEQSARYFRQRADGSVDADPNIPGFNYDVVAGVNYTLDLSRPVGDRLTQLDYDGRPVAPTDTFTMALNNYRQTGGGGFTMLRGAPVVYDRQLEIRQLLIDEVRSKGVLRPGDYFHQNWKVVPLAALGRLLQAP